MTKDPYQDFAERYDKMKFQNPAREKFFKSLFVKYNITTVLDCACGTGQDLILFHSFGFGVHGSDLSGAMLAQARKNITEAKLSIPLEKVDFRSLDQHFKSQFDAVVCLSNSINEPLNDSDTHKALLSMKVVLREKGILVLDQGQTDATMKDPPKFAPIVNDRDFSRLFVMEYSNDQMEVRIFDFIHTEKERDFKHASVQYRIRLKDDWEQLLKQVEFSKIDFYGDWKFTPYDKDKSKRLIIVAQK